jgi:hypothetical protein
MASKNEAWASSIRAYDSRKRCGNVNGENHAE